MTAEKRVERASNGEWAVAVAIVLVGSGMVTGSPFLVSLAALPLCFVAAAALSTPPDGALDLQREFSFGTGAAQTEAGELSGDPGEPVTVRVTVENTGRDPLVDVRVADSVPEGLPVVDGTPRTCLTVSPGETETFEYEVELRQGEHVFTDANVRLRGVGGLVVETWTEAVSGGDTLRCLPAVHRAPLDDGTNDYAGEIPTDEGGSGVEFYSIREYEPGDPTRSIDWRRYANTRDLATIEFRAERATRVVCIVDRRTSQNRARSERHLPALGLSVAAAQRTFDAVVDAGYPAGIIGFGERYQVVLDPGTDAVTVTKGRELLEALQDPKKQPSDHGNTSWGSAQRRIPALLPGEAQVILFSSFVDDVSTALIEQLRTHSYPVIVVSPDVASGRTDVAGRLAAVERRTRLADAQRTGAQVVDWDVTTPLGLVLGRVVREVSSR